MAKLYFLIKDNYKRIVSSADPFSIFRKATGGVSQIIFKLKALECKNIVMLHYIHFIGCYMSVTRQQPPSWESLFICENLSRAPPTR